MRPLTVKPCVSVPAALALVLVLAAALVGAQAQGQPAQGALAAQDARLAEDQFNSVCAACHGKGGTGGDRAPALVETTSMRPRTVAQIEEIIRSGTPRGMPAFPLPQAELNRLARWLRAQNASAYEARPAGDVAAGERFFFGEGECASCHAIHGRGGSNGPDLTTIGLRSTVKEIGQVLSDPTSQAGLHNTTSCPGWAFCPDFQWSVVRVKLRSGETLRGFSRNQSEHDIQLQTFDGKLHLLTEDEYLGVEREQASHMPALQAGADKRRDLVAFLSSLGGYRLGPIASGAVTTSAEMRVVSHSQPGQWPGYNADQGGNRHSALKQINTRTIAGLRPQWIFSPGGTGLQNTPVVQDGVMYVTGATQVCAISAERGRSIWCVPRTYGELVPGTQPAPRAAPGGGARPADGQGAGAAPAAPRGPNRGVAILGDSVFYTTDDAYLVCLNRLTGAIRWVVSLPEEGAQGRYGTSSSPMVVGDLVISGVSGGDSPLRGFLAAYKATTGELAWRFWTIPKPGEPLSETWAGRALPTGGGATWVTGSYDRETDTLYWAVGNPYPSTDGSQRGGANLYSNSVVALEPRTGKVKWHYQFTPHDLHDWDATEPMVLADAQVGGRMRRVLMQANRNGYFYVLDRDTGAFIYAKPFVKRLTWSSGFSAHGVPLLLPNNTPQPGGTLTCPSVRGATNWYAPAYNPDTRLFYVMAAEDCSIYRPVGRIYEGVRDPSMASERFVRAIDVDTGAIAWERRLVGAQEANYTGILSTDGGLIFFGETGGAFSAADARTGKLLWTFQTTDSWRASPMTYTVKGRQYVAVASGANILAFALDRSGLR